MRAAIVCLARVGCLGGSAGGCGTYGAGACR